jgi:RNA polymerase-binding transcription factor DksA
LLDAEERRLDRAIDELRSIALDEGPDEHDAGEPAWTSEDAAGAASDTLTREVGYGLIEDFRGALEDVRHARHRLLRDQYGLCARCATEIDPMRLEAVPATRWCLSCARDVERDVRLGLFP